VGYIDEFVPIDSEAIENLLGDHREQDPWDHRRRDDPHGDRRSGTRGDTSSGCSTAFRPAPPDPRGARKRVGHSAAGQH
jgi:hypothetical protein